MKADLLYGSHDFRSNVPDKRIRFSTRFLRKEQKIYFSQNKAIEESVRMGGYDIDPISSGRQYFSTSRHPMKEVGEFWID